MYWAALLLDKPSDAASLHDDLQGLATWALQWTPRVAIVDEAVCIEVEASLRLFGGKRALRERIRTEGAELGLAIASWAPTSLAALAFARAGIENGFARPLTEGLDRLPLEVPAESAAGSAETEPSTSPAHVESHIRSGAPRSSTYAGRRATDFITRRLQLKASTLSDRTRRSAASECRASGRRTRGRCRLVP